MRKIIVRFFDNVLGRWPHYLGGGLIRSVFWWKFTKGGRIRFESIDLSGRSNVRIGGGSTFMALCCIRASTGQVIIGEHVSVNRNVLIDANNGGHIVIGSQVLVGPNVVMRASNHKSDLGRPVAHQGHVGGIIEIGSDVWIGSNVVILAGVVIEPGVVIAAGAVVTGRCKTGLIYAGVPAKPIGQRGEGS